MTAHVGSLFVIRRAAPAAAAMQAPATLLALVLAAALALLAALVPAAVHADESLSLADAVRIAAGDAPGVAIAKLSEDEARAKHTQARGVLLPSLSATASDANRTFSLKAQGISLPSIPGQPAFREPLGPVESFDARLRASQPLLDPAGIARVKAADFEQRRATAERNASAESAAQQAAAAYLRAIRAQAVVAARLADERIAADLFALADAQQTAGTAPRIDATRARTELAAARGLTLVARNQLDRSLIDLARALGKGPDWKITLADTLGGDLARSDAPEVASTAVGVGLERRAEMAAQRAKESKVRADRSAISAERLPRIDASADVGLSGANAEHSVTTRTYGVALSMPIFDGFRREGRISEQRAAIEANGVRIKDLSEQIAAEVQAALLDLGSGREQLAVADERLALAQEELDQSRERFTSGVAGNIEVINAQTSLVRARDAEIDARYAIASARVALARATGVARSLR